MQRLADFFDLSNSQYWHSEPLKMDNGRDLIEMVVHKFETPDNLVSEDSPGYDYSPFLPTHDACCLSLLAWKSFTSFF
jgi:hypothetical protein